MKWLTCKTSQSGLCKQPLVSRYGIHKNENSVIIFLPPVMNLVATHYILLHMDPHAFDQSLQKTSPKMNPAVRMMLLRQGTRSIEEYVVDFLELAHLTQLDEICLMIFFRGGLSEPLSSIMPLHEATWTLEEYSDLALKLSGSPFTVGVAEEENHRNHRNLHCRNLSQNGRRSWAS